MPDEAQMRSAIGYDDRKHLGQYYDTPRHTIQVDFARYVKGLDKEIEAGVKRAGSSKGAR